MPRRGPMTRNARERSLFKARAGALATATGADAGR
jgi:hypothetical protein